MIGTEVVAAAKWGWPLLAKVPWLSGFIIRKRFTPSVCREKVCIHGDSARFEFVRQRPMPALCGVMVHLHNHLPFDIDAHFRRIRVSINSWDVVDFPLTSRLKVSSSSPSKLLLPDVVLVERQVEWIKSLEQTDVYVKITLNWSAKSDFTNWEQVGDFTSVAPIRLD